ncbi:MAG: response regulator transcription factor [Elusimicrobia bacterium]|nr:response regulator transcription factor [Elusimicrobiota bacterium]
MHITIAGDDEKFCAQIQKLLEEHNHKVAVLARVGHVLEALRAEPPHLLIIVKPFFHETLTQFLHVLREVPPMRRMPVVCVNPKGGSSEGVKYLEAGADDFINRPFNPQIFLARVRTLLRRAVMSGDIREEEITALRCGAVEVKLVSRQVSVSGKPVVLTRLEFDLLAHLMKSPERVFKRQELLDAIWNYPDTVETRTLDKHVETLRRKLGPAGTMVATVHGVGYCFKAPAPSSAARKP